MKKVILMIGIVTVSLRTVQAQEVDGNGTPHDLRYGFSVGYYGLRHTWGVPTHGAQVGVERYLATTHNFRIIGAFLFHAGYRSGNNLVMTLCPRIGFRYTAGWGLMAEQFLGIGYMPTQYLYDTYRINDNGEVVNFRREWLSSGIVSLTVGAGYDLSRRFALPVTVYARAEGGIRYPVAHPMFALYSTVGAGVVYTPRMGMKTPKSKP